MTASTAYSAVRNGRIVHVTPERGSEAERQRWRELGVHLHGLMDAAITEAQLILPDHPDDDEHNIAVGRTMEMIAAGDVSEGAAFYNAWSGAHAYPGVSIIRLDPPQLDIGTAIGGMVAELRDGEITILSAGPDWVRPGFERVPVGSFWNPIQYHGRLILPRKQPPTAHPQHDGGSCHG